MNNILVYRHRTLDTHEVFYIGIGSLKRSKSRHRSIFWKNVVDKHNYYVEILRHNLSWEEACELEQLLIKEYGRRDLRTGCLVNMTDGGEGSPGKKIAIKTREKMSKSHKGKKLTKEHKINLSIAKKGIAPSLITKNKQLEAISKKVLHLPSNIIYKSAKEVSIVFGINYLNLIRRLNGTYKNNTQFKYY